MVGLRDAHVIDEGAEVGKATEAVPEREEGQRALLVGVESSELAEGGNGVEAETGGVEEEMAEGDVLAEGAPEVVGEGVHDGSATEGESLERARYLEELVEGLGCLVLALVDDCV